MFSSQFEYTDNNSGYYADKINQINLLWAVKGNPLQLDFMKIVLFGEYVHSI